MADDVDDPDDPDDRIGRLVDERYKILEEMAAGAMGAVYKAERVPVGKLVAIKFLHKSYAKDAEFLTRFERETRAMSKLAHPNCVSVVDFGVWEQAPYLVMDYVAGITLRALLDREQLAPPRALALGRQIAAGLAHAHAQGIVHRDIKPANIMISDEIGAGEHVRLLDFGLARLRGGGSGGRDATQTNVVVGTPNYMAPEQTIPGMTIDARADVYALGVVLYEMLAGERPFNAPDTMSLLGMHRAAPIPRLADRVDDPTELPDGAQAVIDTAMAKSPDDRYQTAVELAEAIEGLLGGGRVGEAARAGSSGSRPVKRQTATTGTAAAAAVAVAMAPTMVDEARAERSESEPDAAATVQGRRRATSDAPKGTQAWRRPLLGATILAIGVAGGAALLIAKQAAKETQTAAAMVVDAGVGVAPVVEKPIVGSAAGSAAAGSGSAVAAETGTGAGTGSGTGTEAGTAAGSGSGSGSAIVAVAGSDAGSATDAGSGTGTGSGSGSGDIEIDPTTAEDLEPHPTIGSDEAADAPATADEAAKKPPAAPPTEALATTVVEARQMIKDGKHDLALRSLLALSKKSPGSAYIPFLLGNLYYDQLWWGVAMEHYQTAIAHDAAYRGNATLNHNVIRMLGSAKTQTAAATFLRKVVGRPAVAFLKQAAQHEDNPIIRRQAAIVAKGIR